MTTSTTGGWYEVAQPGSLIEIDKGTMPHILLSNADGTFTLKAAEWDKRKAGDDDTVPFPSFIGSRLNDVFFANNRLGFLSGENVILSRAGGEFYNFFQEKASQTLDTDPIDVASTEKDITVLTSAIPFDESILVFAPKAQLKLAHNGVQGLTPQTAEMKPISRFENYDSAYPVATGTSIMFTVDRGDWAGIREFLTTNDGAVAPELTEHVPRYLPRGTVRLAVVGSERTLVALSENDRHSLYVYSWFDKEGTRVQSAWSVWTFFGGDTILDIGTFGSDLVLLIQRDDGLYIELMSLGSARADAGASFTTHLDRRVNDTRVTTTYDSATGLSTITLPYTMDYWSQPNMQVWTRVLTGDGSMVRQLHSAVTSPNTLVCPGDLRTAKFFVGREYASYFDLSEQYLRQDGVPRTDGTLKLRRAEIIHGKTAGYRVQVGDDARTRAAVYDPVAVSAQAYAALAKFRTEDPVAAGVSFELVAPSTLPGDWPGYYPSTYTGELRGKVNGVAAASRYYVRLGVLTSMLSDNGSFGFLVAPSGIKTLELVRTADGAVVHKEDFETGQIGTSGTIDPNRSSILRAFSAGSEYGAKGTPLAQATALLASIQSGDEATANARLRGLDLMVESMGAPTMVYRPTGSSASTSIDIAGTAWAAIAAARFKAAFPSSTLASTAQSLASRACTALLGTTLTMTSEKLLAYFAFAATSGYSSDATGLATSIMSTLYVPSAARFTATADEPGLLVDALGALFLNALGKTAQARLASRWLAYYVSTNGTADGFAPYAPSLELQQGDYRGIVGPSWTFGSLLAAMVYAAVGDRTAARAALVSVAPLLSDDGAIGSLGNTEHRSAADTAMFVIAETPAGLFGSAAAALRSEGSGYVSLNKSYTYRALCDTPTDDGSQSFPVGMESARARIRVRSRGALPFGVLSVSWEGFYTTRSKKV